MKKRCQSCGMPFKNDNQIALEKDGSKSEYCVMCYENGVFLQPDISLQEMKTFCINILNKDMKIPKFIAKFMLFTNVTNTHYHISNVDSIVNRTTGIVCFSNYAFKYHLNHIIPEFTVATSIAALIRNNFRRYSLTICNKSLLCRNGISSVMPPYITTWSGPRKCMLIVFSFLSRIISTP